MALLALTVGLLLVASGESFLMIRVKPGLVTVQPGEEINLLCVVDSAYELCRWYNPQQQHCDFEWKRMIGNITTHYITTQKCQFPDKIAFHGLFPLNECGIRINSASVEDTGKWRCKVEQYVFPGSQGSGSVRVSEIEVRVEASSTEAPDLLTTSTATTVPSTRSTSTSSPEPCATDQLRRKQVLTPFYFLLHSER